MKKISIIICILTILSSIVSCGSSPSVESKSSPSSTVASTTAPTSTVMSDQDQLKSYIEKTAKQSENIYSEFTNTQTMINMEQKSTLKYWRLAKKAKMEETSAKDLKKESTSYFDYLKKESVVKDADEAFAILNNSEALNISIDPSKSLKLLIDPYEGISSLTADEISTVKKLTPENVGNTKCDVFQIVLTKNKETKPIEVKYTLFFDEKEGLLKKVSTDLVNLGKIVVENTSTKLNIVTDNDVKMPEDLKIKN